MGVERVERGREKGRHCLQDLMSSIDCKDKKDDDLINVNVDDRNSLFKKII